MNPLVRCFMLPFLLLGLAAPASAGRFDFIYTDQIDVTLCGGCGITLAGIDFAVLVNKDSAPIPIDSLLAARFTATTTEPSVRLFPFLNFYGAGFTGLAPNHARGSVGPPNAFLETLLQPGEVFENTYGLQFLAFQIDQFGLYGGPVRFDCTLQLNGEQVAFTIHANLSVGQHAIRFLHGTRTSSSPGSPGGDPFAARLDVKPGSCTNPVNLRSHGVVPMAILGSSTLDVSAIDVSSLRLADSIPPVRSSLEDVSGPPGGAGACACPAGPDGRTDLTLKFDMEDVARALRAGATTITVSGRMNDGTTFRASDCVEVHSTGGVTHMDLDSDLGPAPAVARLSYTLTRSTDVGLNVYDVSGRLVQSLVRYVQPRGDHVVEWDTGGHPSGMYFFRLQAAGQSEIRKFLLTR